MGFVKKVRAVVLIFVLGTVISGVNAQVFEHPATDVYDGWRLGVQLWTFNRFTFYEAIDKTAELGLDWLEAYPGQILSIDMPDIRFDHNLPEELCNEVKQKLAQAGIRLVNYGVVGLDEDVPKCRRVFDFARKMGIETIVAEPPEEALEMLDSLCAEYGINLAIHNHPKPSHYWNPDTVLAACKGRSKYIGACADTGHWVRAGLDPVECLKKLEGRVKSLHFKEIDDGHDVVWGSGKARVPEILKELDRQKFTGVFAIEYEYNWENSLPEIRQCIDYFDGVAGTMKPSGWERLFAGDLSDAVFKEGSWTLTDGVLALDGKGDIWTKSSFGDFAVDMEFRLDDKTNSGVFIRAGEMTWLPWAEVQIEDSFGKPADTHICGAIFDVLAPAANAVKKAGQWNRLTIRADGPKIDVVMNGVHIINMDIDKWTQAGKNPDGTKNKFDIAYKDLPRCGLIGLQDHGSRVWYRNIKIRKLN